MDSLHPDAAHKMTRGLGLYDSTMIVAGSMIGSGIFIVAAEMSREVGSAGWMMMSWLVASVLTMAAALSYGELAAMIVHEVRNPLTTVMMGLKSFESLDLSDRSRTRLDLATAEAERLQRLLNEILQYARCQTLQTTELEINSLIQGMLESLRAMPAAAERQIVFTAIQPTRVLGDRDKLMQVFINLISNACEAIPAGETVTWSLETCKPQRYIWIRIHNGGEPIPPDILMQLTMPFFTTKSSGNGLGLAIVKRIVEAHMGELEIASSTDIGGTCVTVSLPYVE
jgi:signal transduction histidine kinase